MMKTLLAAGAALLLAVQAQATWSIVVVDHGTREVGVAGATCVPNLQVQRFIGVVAVGKGAGAAQNVVDPTGQNRVIMFNLLRDGATPEEIFDRLSMLQSWGPSQVGLTAFSGDPRFKNAGGAAALGVTGQLGSMTYSIQGNVLAGDAVILECERTFRETDGDMGQRLMAAMETARDFGGDGRCSCDEDDPTGCGSPPPNFVKTAHSAFVTVARIGDVDGTCSSMGGCVTGQYYLDRKARGGVNDPAPVALVRERYDEWRANRIGIVDGLLSEVQREATRLPADGVTETRVTVRTRDLDGNPLAFGGFPLYVRGIGGPQAASVQSVDDNGDGTFTIHLRAGSVPGHCRWRLVAVQNGFPRTLHPPLELDLDPVAPLHVGVEEVSAAAGANVPLVTNAGSGNAQRPYLVLASASGTTPGTTFMGETLPLNTDRLLRFTLTNPGPPRFPGSIGLLDPTGRGEATLRANTAMLSPFVGGRFDFATVVFGDPLTITDPVGFDILP